MSAGRQSRQLGSDLQLNRALATAERGHTRDEQLDRIQSQRPPVHLQGETGAEFMADSSPTVGNLRMTTPGGSGVDTVRCW
jgi:hypothetical protein